MSLFQTVLLTERLYNWMMDDLIKFKVRSLASLQKLTVGETKIQFE